MNRWWCDLSCIYHTYFLSCSLYCMMLDMGGALPPAIARARKNVRTSSRFEKCTCMWYVDILYQNWVFYWRGIPYEGYFMGRSWVYFVWPKTWIMRMYFYGLIPFFMSVLLYGVDIYLPEIRLFFHHVSHTAGVITIWRNLYMLLSADGHCMNSGKHSGVLINECEISLKRRKGCDIASMMNSLLL